jgi:hypothetical protein
MSSCHVLLANMLTMRLLLRLMLLPRQRHSISKNRLPSLLSRLPLLRRMLQFSGKPNVLQLLCKPPRRLHLQRQRLCKMPSGGWAAGPTYSR